MVNQFYRDNSVLGLISECHSPSLKNFENFLLDIFICGMFNQFSQLFHERFRANLKFNFLMGEIEGEILILQIVLTCYKNSLLNGGTHHIEL